MTANLMLKQTHEKEDKMIFEMKNLTKKFGKFTALDGVNMHLNEGEILGFLGPNGAGKSTTLRILLGMLKKTSGEIKLFDKDCFKDVKQTHQKLVYVPGEVNLWPSLTGGETIDFLASLHKINTKSGAYLTKKEYYLHKFDLDAEKKAKQYSKGNKQKVALIAAFLVAYISDIRLIVLDEPTSGLDPLMEEKFVEEIKEFKKLEKSVLLSSHILSEVEKLCDRVAIIKDGKIIKEGTIGEIKAAHGEGESLESAFIESYAKNG